jgi:hypothetical protein
MILGGIQGQGHFIHLLTKQSSSFMTRIGFAWWCEIWLSLYFYVIFGINHKIILRLAEMKASPKFKHHLSQWYFLGPTESFKRLQQFSVVFRVSIGALFFIFQLNLLNQQ